MDHQPPLPTSLGEVESLILALYNPHTPHTTIATIQETLQRIQRSPEGWQLSQALLDRPTTSTADDQVKFFGALTIIVKLNTESSILADEDAHELLQNLIRWLIGSAGNNAAVLSTQKLCHALVTLFIYFPHLWPKAVRHLLLCLRTGSSVPPENANSSPTVAELAAGLDWHLLRVTLWFINTLVTDVGKTDMRVAKYSAVHDELLENAGDVAALLHAGITLPISEPQRAVTLRRESIKSLQSWVLYAQRLPAGGEVLVVPLRALVSPVIVCLEDEELYEVAIELLTDILTNYSAFFTAEHHDALASIFESPWGEQHMQQLLKGDFDFEPLQYGLLLLAYGDARVQTLLQSPDARSQKTLATLCMLLTATGHPVAEDQIFVPALEFWSTFVETMLDTMYSDQEEQKPWLQSSLAVVMQAVGHCWEKIQYPPIKAFMSWDSSDRAGFGDARKDVGDLLQTVFSVSGRDLLVRFADLLLRSVNDKAWPQIEAAAFCVAAMSDCISDDNSFDDVLSSIFSSPLFSLLQLGEAHLPVRLRQTALTLIERYSEYFERHADHLPAVLNLLFEAVSTPSLASQASKAISTLCSSCRSILVSEAGAFLQQYQLLHANPLLDAFAEERIVNAIAAIIQATNDVDTRLSLFERLLTFVVRDIEQCLQLKSSGGQNSLDADSPLVAKAVRQVNLQQAQEKQAVPSVDEVLLQTVLIPLRCLAAMARGLQATTETVDLDDDVPSNGYAADAASDARLYGLQANIMAMVVAVQTAFSRSGEVVESICSILKAGFSETDPGPFVFPPAMVTDFLVGQSVQTPYIGAMVNTAYAFASSLHKGSDYEAMTKSLGTLTPWAIGLLQMLQDPDADPELTQRGIEFVDRVLQKSPAVVLQLQPTSLLEFFFVFTLKVLDGREPLPKAASADFWTTFITLKPADATLQAATNNALEHLGPLLAQSLMQNIGGNASRSELDKLSEPLKKLVVQHPRASTWLEQALSSPAFPSERVTAAEKALFLKKIVNLRGSRQTNVVVREFWLASRGSSFAYAS